MKLSVLILCLLLLACVRHEVTPEHITEAQGLCEPNSGLLAITEATTYTLQQADAVDVYINYKQVFVMTSDGWYSKGD